MNTKKLDHPNFNTVHVTNWAAEYVLELEAQLEDAKGALNEARNMFVLQLVEPREPPVSAHDYLSLWERDKRDARVGLKAIVECLKRLEGKE